MTVRDFANSGADKTAPSSDKTGPNQLALVEKIRELFPRDTVKCLAAWLKTSIDTARHRIKCEREFSLDEVVTLLRDEHGYQILKSLMDQAPRKPRWWRACEPLMKSADLERQVLVLRKAAVNNATVTGEIINALENEIRRAQTLAVSDEEFTRPHLDALGAFARVVAPKR